MENKSYTCPICKTYYDKEPAQCGYCYTTAKEYRWQFAGMAMKGLIISTNFCSGCRNESITKKAVELADNLIAELLKKKDL